jgi:hypothetical protein
MSWKIPPYSSTMVKTVKIKVNQAIRQSGNQAIRQSGNQAIRQSGNQAIIPETV